MLESDSETSNSTPVLAGYEGRWVALLDGKIIAQGGTPDQAYIAAKKSRHKENPQVVYVPMNEMLRFPLILDEITAYLPSDLEIYLVGGAVRDSLLNRSIRDLDFIVVGDSLKIARQLANEIGAAYFPLDEERDTARLVLGESNSERIYLDFSAQRGQSLESDLSARDFTINAMAVNIWDRQKILDPLNGGIDLLNRRLRVCSPTSIQDDPLRILRAIRLAGEFDLRITPETRKVLRDSVDDLPGVSAERIRDELFRILASGQAARSIRALDVIGALPYVLPDLSALKGVEQTSPHIADVWEHTLDVLKRLDLILNVLSNDYDPDKAANLLIGMTVIRLGRYRQGISEHLKTILNIDRSLRGLLFFSALYHDVGKANTMQMGDDGSIHFYNHERISAKVAAKKARELRLNNNEINRLATIIRGHMRPLLLAQLEKPPSGRAIYRFFRDTGSAGVDICLLALADTLATYGTQIPPDKWLKLIDVIRVLYEAWWDRSREYVNLPNLIQGGDLIEAFNLNPGPLIGELLEAVREAQVSGEVQTREQSLAYVKDILRERLNNSL